MEDIELDVGGTKIKGVWIAILISFASTIGGGIWAASEFFSRLEAQEESVSQSISETEKININFDNLKVNTTEKLSEMTTKIEKVEQQLEDNDVSSLQGKLAELGTNLKTIMERQQELLNIQSRIVEVEKQVNEMEVIVQKAENITKNSAEISSKLNIISREIEDLWKGLDAVANPL
jgi:DNA repair ATPase RecN